MQPVFKIHINDQDKTALFQPLFISLAITDDSGFSADTLELELSDDGKLAYPKKESEILIWTGYKDLTTGKETLRFKGNYKLDDVEFPFPDYRMIIRASGARLRGSFTAPKDATWQETTFGAIAKTIAARHGFELAISDVLSAKPIMHKEQKSQSDSDLLTRMAKDHNATMKPAGNKLVIFARNDGKNVSGKAMPPVPITLNQKTRGTVKLVGRQRYKSVAAQYRNLDSAALAKVETSNDAPQKLLPNPFDDKDQAKEAAYAELDELQRKQFQLIINRMPAMQELRAEMPIDVSGHRRSQANGQWIIQTITETMDDAGFHQSVTAVYPKKRFSEIPN